MAEKTRVKSSVDALPDEERAYLNALLADINIPYTEAAKRMTERGYPLSRSAVHRYAIRTSKATARLTQARDTVNVLVAAMKDNQDVEATEVASAMLLDGLLTRIAVAEDDYDDMPMKDVIDSVAKLQRTTVYKERMRKDRSRVIASVESNIMRRLQAELPNKDPELLARLQAMVSDAAREEAARDAVQDA